MNCTTILQREWLAASPDTAAHEQGVAQTPVTAAPSRVHVRQWWVCVEEESNTIPDARARRRCAERQTVPADGVITGRRSRLGRVISWCAYKRGTPRNKRGVGGRDGK